MDRTFLKEFLDEKSALYNHPDFIQDDPIRIPHRFSKLQDIEIAGFLTATISWGNRKSILKSADKMLGLLENTPYDFVLNFSKKDLQIIKKQAVHRTFSGEDLSVFLLNLRRIYRKHSSMENLFLLKKDEEDLYHSFHRFREFFFADEFKTHRSNKHISSTYKNSAAKRLMMFLRWMVRNDQKGVDLGVWEAILPRYLSIPLDVHTADISRKLELVSRKQNDWKTVQELDSVLRKFNPEDPAKYDFALFGLGVSGEFK